MDVSKKFPWIPKCLHFFTKSFQVISYATHPLQFGHVPANLSRKSGFEISNLNTPENAPFWPIFRPILPFFGPKKLVTYFQIHQGANQTHWNRFRAKYGCLQKIPMDSKMSPFFYKIFSSHFESREPGFLQRIILVLTLCNSPTTIWACPSQLKPKIWL